MQDKLPSLRLHPWKPYNCFCLVLQLVWSEQHTLSKIIVKQPELTKSRVPCCLQPDVHVGRPKLKALFRCDPNHCGTKMPTLKVQSVYMRAKMQRIWACTVQRREGCVPTALCLRFYPLWRSFGSVAVGWVGCFGVVPPLPSHWWRHICAGRSGCSASIPAFMIARRCESRNTLYCTQTQKLMKLDCLPGRKFLNVCVR